MNKPEHILGTMAHFAHQQVNMLFVALTLGQIVEMANDAKAPVWQGDPLDFPIVGFYVVGILAPPDAAWSIVRFTRCQRMAKAADDFRCKRFRPDDPKHFS